MFLVRRVKRILWNRDLLWTAIIFLKKDNMVCFEYYEQKIPVNHFDIFDFAVFVRFGNTLRN